MSRHELKTTLEINGREYEMEIDYTYEPSEPESMYSPGTPPDVEVKNCLMYAGTWVVLPDDLVNDIAPDYYEQCLEHAVSECREARMEAQLERSIAKAEYYDYA